MSQWANIEGLWAIPDRSLISLHFDAGAIGVDVF